ncbi:hypothetical protein ACP8HI_09970 [Paenibacillus sp. FA6]|uniref:hypothetical protein n=1 Tax=Paenibacillus sp. FA6 TaxID=3413029 RepID=UPI003F65D1C5
MSDISGYMERILLIKKDLYELANRMTNCDSQDKEFYGGIAEQFATHLKAIQYRCIMSKKEKKDCLIE